MYNILIVDDEPLQVNSMYEYITAHCSGEYECLKAYSPTQALTLAAHTRIDIALLDIEMPIMDGMKLRERLKSIYPHCHIIFLTAYDRFDYVYAAAQQHQTRFLLKTERNDVVLAMIREECRELDYELIHGRFPSDQIDDLLPGYEKNDFLRLILSGTLEASCIEHEAQRFNMPLDVRRMVMPILLRLADEERSYSEDYAVIVRAAHFFRGWFAEYYVIMFLQVSREYTLFLMQPAKNVLPKADLKQDLELYLSKTIQICSRQFSLALANDWTSWDSLAQKVALMREKLENSITEGGEYICQLNDHALAAADMIRLGDELVRYLQKNDEIKLRQIISEGNQLAQAIDISFAEFLFRQFERVQFKRSWNDWEYDYHQMVQFANQLEKAYCEEDLTAIAIEFANGISQKRSQQTCEERKYVVRKTNEYIKAHYSEDISLSDLARYVCLSSAYLSRVYKRETGMNIIEKIKEVRIKEAVLLLKTTNMKIQDVAAAVGYNSSRYFNSVFRSIVGIKPTEYREEKQ